MNDLTKENMEIKITKTELAQIESMIEVATNANDLSNTHPKIWKLLLDHFSLSNTYDRGNPKDSLKNIKVKIYTLLEEQKNKERAEIKIKSQKK